MIEVATNRDKVIIMFWDPVTFKEDQCLHWQIGPCKLWVRRTEDEWQAALQRDGNVSGLVEAEPQDAPTDVTWNRHAAIADAFMFRILPIMPDRPVVVRPESLFSFPPASDLHFYVSIPIWLRLCTGTEGTGIFSEEPATILSSSWFGDPMAGRLCYALKTTARRSSRQLRSHPHLAACRVEVRNRSEKMLSFERLCIHAEHLHIYHNGKRFWTNQVTVTYGGDNQPDSVEYGSAPKPAGDVNIITEAREPTKTSRIKKSFSDLKAFVRM